MLHFLSVSSPALRGATWEWICCAACTRVHSANRPPAKRPLTIHPADETFVRPNVRRLNIRSIKRPHTPPHSPPPLPASPPPAAAHVHSGVRLGARGRASESATRSPSFPAAQRPRPLSLQGRTLAHAHRTRKGTHPINHSHSDTEAGSRQASRQTQTPKKAG